MEYTVLSHKARDFAKEKHKGQVDDNGNNYYHAHLAQVVNILHNVTGDRFILSAAWLHDTIEDTDTTYEELEKEFGKRFVVKRSEQIRNSKRILYLMERR